MDGAFVVTQWTTTTGIDHRHDFGGNRQSDFFGCFRADIQARRGMDVQAGKCLGATHACNALTRSERADISHGRVA